MPPPIASQPFSAELTIANGAAAYIAGDSVGAMFLNRTVPMAFLSGDLGPILIVTSVCAVDPDNQKAAFDLLFFNGTITDPGDNNAFSPSAADAQKAIGRIGLSATDWTTYGSRAIAEKAAIAESMKLAGAKVSIAFINQGAPTYATASGLRVRITGILT